MTDQEVDQLAEKIAEETDETLLLAIAVEDLQARVKMLEERIEPICGVRIPPAIRAAMHELQVAR